MENFIAVYLLQKQIVIYFYFFLNKNPLFHLYICMLNINIFG